MNIIEKYKEIDKLGKQLVASLKIHDEYNKEKESIGILLYCHEDKELEIWDIDKDNTHTIPSFNESGMYTEQLLVENEKKKYLLLKRTEFSLSDYNISIKDKKEIKLVKNYVKEHIFYDVLIIEDNKLFIIESHEENKRLTYKEIKGMIENNSDKVYILDVKNNNKQTLEDFSFNTKYLFEFGQYIHKNKKIKSKIISISKAKGLDFYQYQLMKIYDFYIYRNLNPKYILNGHNDYYKVYADKTLYSLFYNSIVQNYLIDGFNLPNSYKKINTIEHLDLLLKAPSLENLWSVGSMDNFFNIRCYKKYIDSNVSTNIIFNDKMRKELINFYQISNFKILQKKDIIYSKKISSLLNEKIEFLQSGKEEGEIYISIFDLFSNKDNLQTFVKMSPFLKIYRNEIFNNVFSITIPTEFIKKEDYLKYNVLSIQNELEILEKTKKKFNKEEKIESLYKRIHKNRFDVDTRHITSIDLTGEEVSNLLLKVFVSKEVLEKSYIQLFEEVINHYGEGQERLVANRFAYKKINLDVFSEHLEDILEPYFLMYYIYENKLYGAKLEPYFNKFFNSSFSNFKKFEEGLRELEGILKSGELSRQIPLESFNYPVTNEYKMKQPENGFELKYIGDTMRHCVFSYFDRLIKKDRNTYIVSIYKENEPIVCIEIRNKSVFNKEKKSLEFFDEKEIVQAKLKYNTPVLNNDKLNKIVCEFALLNNLKISTNDIKY